MHAILPRRRRRYPTRRDEVSRLPEDFAVQAN